MNVSLHDMIHVTEGERLLAYRWLWLGIATSSFAVGLIIRTWRRG